LIGREDGQIEAWDLDGSTRTHHIDTGDKPIQSLKATAEGTVSIAFRGGGVSTWNLATGELREVDPLATLDIAVLPHLLACATDGSIVAWREVERTTLAPALPRPPRLAVLSRDGEYVATLKDDDEVLVRRTTGGATLALVPAGDVVTAIGLGSSRRLLALGTAGGAIRLHSTENGELLDVLSSVPAAVRTLAFDAAEQRLIASGEDHVLRVWNLLERELVELRGHEREVVGAGFAGVTAMKSPRPSSNRPPRSRNLVTATPHNVRQPA
jgi:WD40 repeat protein